MYILEGLPTHGYTTSNKIYTLAIAMSQLSVFCSYYANILLFVFAFLVFQKLPQQNRCIPSYNLDKKYKQKNHQNIQ